MYQDIKKYHLENDFIHYIFGLNQEPSFSYIETFKTPFELMDEAGYHLYLCLTEKDIQRFKKYYTKKEELCTFRGGRLKHCIVFFAVKKDVDQIRREDFSHPEREDLYGTSVLSIQFTRTTRSVLSIKNRYNHTVSNPDATFSNHLDSIIPGLHMAFSNYLQIDLSLSPTSFEIPNYCYYLGKYYKYNMELIGTYYGVSNHVISYNGVHDYPKEKFLLFDYFILDLVKKEIRVFDKAIIDSFPTSFPKISHIEISSSKDFKSVYLFSQGQLYAVITLNSRHQMVGLRMDSITEIENHFCSYACFLKSFEAPKLRVIKNSFLETASHLQYFKCENLEEVGDYFLPACKYLKELKLNSLKKVGNHFLHENFSLKKFECSSLEEVGDSFLYYENSLISFCANRLKKVGNDFFCQNQSLVYLECNSLEEVGNYFMSYNQSLQVVHLEKLKSLNYKFLALNYNREVEKLRLRIFLFSLQDFKKKSLTRVLKKINVVFFCLF